MSEPREPAKPGPGEDETDAASSDLEAAFERWDETRREIAWGDPDAPLTQDELANECELARDPEVVLRRAHQALRKRLLMMVLLLGGGLAVVAGFWSDLRYLLQREGDLVDLGDVRERFMAGERYEKGSFDLRPDTWVAMQNLIPTEERETKEGMVYFFDAITKTLVITHRKLPEKNLRSRVALHGVMVDSRLRELLVKRWMFPADVSVSFSAQGRLVHARDAPRGRIRTNVDVYRKELKLDERLEGDFWVLFDGQRPGDMWVYGLICAVALLLAGLSVIFWLRARSRLRDLRAMFDAETVAALR